MFREKSLESTGAQFFKVYRKDQKIFENTFKTNEDIIINKKLDNLFNKAFQITLVLRNCLIKHRLCCEFAFNVKFHLTYL